MFDGVPADRLAEVQTQFVSRLYVTPNGGNWALYLNTRTAPFTNLAVRPAINYAVDRAQVAALLGNDSQPACQILPVGLPGYRPYCPYTVHPSPDGAWNGPDLARARTPDSSVQHARDADHHLEHRRTIPRARRSISRVTT
jgi:peptide/nickel transport system substrate-binding protein